MRPLFARNACALRSQRSNLNSSIVAIILAAGQSKRMGDNKMLLPFARSTVIETIVREVAASRVNAIVVVTGHAHDQIEALLSSSAARCIFNPDYARHEMIVSVQVGLQALPSNIDAALIVLGDQPRLQHDIIQRIMAAYLPDLLIVPAYRYQRGHPILIARALWGEISALPPTSTLRDFIRSHEDRIRYVEVDSDSILRDMDTPQDYQENIHREDVKHAKKD